jgi:hypothetical protein
MRAAMLVCLVIGAASAPAAAQPLEQGFAFGAPLGVLGNDRFRRTAFAPPPMPAVRVRFAEPRRARSPERSVRRP